MGRPLSEEEARDWIQNHGPRINAGDAADILWEEGYNGAYRLMGYKLGWFKRPPQTAEMLNGVETEPIIFDWYQKLTGMTGISQAWHAYSDWEAIQGKADFYNEEHRHLAEFKTPSRDSFTGEPRDTKDHALATRGEIPFKYQLQCWHLMEVFDALTMDFVSWNDPDDYALIKVQRNTDFWLTEMLPAYIEFHGWLQSEHYPRPDGIVEVHDEEFAMHLRRVREAKQMMIEAENYQARSKAWLARHSNGRVNICDEGRTRWELWRAKSQVNLTTDRPEDAAWIKARIESDPDIMARVRHDRKTGPKLWIADSPPNRVFKVEPKRNK